VFIMLQLPDADTPIESPFNLGIRFTAEQNKTLWRGAAELAKMMQSKTSQDLLSGNTTLEKFDARTLDQQVAKIYSGWIPNSKRRFSLFSSEDSRSEKDKKEDLKLAIQAIGESFLSKSKFSALERSLIVAKSFILYNESDDFGERLQGISNAISTLRPSKSRHSSATKKWASVAVKLPSRWTEDFIPFAQRPSSDDHEIPVSPKPLDLKSVQMENAKHYFFNLNQLELDQIRRVAAYSVIKFRNGGTGFLIDNSGMVVTAGHIVTSLYAPNSEFLKSGPIGYIGGRPISADRTEIFYYSDPTASVDVWKPLGPDLAIIRIPALSGRPYLEFRNTPVTKTEPLILIGHPSKIQDGNLSVPLRLSLGTLLEYSPGPENPRLPRLIFTDNENRGGNSGGPLLDLNGKVLGCLTSAAMRKFGEEPFFSNSSVSESTAQIQEIIRANHIPLKLTKK
jgi:S1-C subfamily serine protease